MAPQDKKPKPVTTLRCSRIKASIWKNEGMNGPFYNVTVARSYKDRDGVWKNSESFGVADLDALDRGAIGPLTVRGSLRPCRRGLPSSEERNQDAA